RRRRSWPGDGRSSATRLLAMLRETVTEFDPGWGELLDVDVLESDDWAGVFLEGERLVVRTPTRTSAAPGGIRAPLIRCLEPGRTVLVDIRTERGRANAWIL